MSNSVNPKKLNIIDKIKLYLEFPKIPKEYDYETINYKIIRKSDYDLMKKIIDRVDNYIEQIKLCNKKIENQQDKYNLLKEEIAKINNKIEEKEQKRRKSASKIGGLQTSLNNQKEKNKILIDLNKKNTKKITELEKELTIEKNKSDFFKNHRRAPSLQEYENYIKANHELEKRNKKEKNKNGTI